MKKKKVALSVLAILLLFVGYGLGCWTRFSEAQKWPRVIVALDAADGQQSCGKAEYGYDPYFTKWNPIPDSVK
jgi:hypothetical protein